MREIAKVVLEFAKPHKMMFCVLFSCVLITSFSNAFYPFIFGKLVDEVFYGRNMRVFLQITIIYAVVYFGNAFLHFMLNMSWAKLMTGFLFDIREACFYKALRLTSSRLSNMSTGDAAERITGDADDFMNLIHWNVFYTAATAISLAVSLVIVLQYNVWFFLIMLILIPVTAVLTKSYRDKTNALHREAAGINGQITGWLFEVVKGVSEIRLLAAKKHVENRFVRKSAQIARLFVEASISHVKSQALTNGLMSFSRIVLFVCAAFFVYNGHLTLGAFVASLDYFNNGVRSFSTLNNKGMEIQKNLGKIRRVIELLNFEEEKYKGEDISGGSGGIRFDNVSFAYEDGNNVLENISFKVNKGETVALVGRSGAGKSTIAGLMLRLYEPDQGTVSAFGMDLSKVSLSSLRKNIGIVLQDNLLFDGTVRDNLLLAKRDATDEEIKAALINANLGEFIFGLENGLDTVIGMGGIGFSGGQKQRLSIARAFLRDPKIIILDEATSSLDAETEEQVKSAWHKLAGNRTTVIIAHRYSTIKNSDRVLVLNDKTIAAFDNHERLLGNEAYDLLFKEQILEFTEAGYEK